MAVESGGYCMMGIGGDGLWGVFGITTWTLFIVALILLIVWLIKQLNKK